MSFTGIGIGFLIISYSHAHVVGEASSLVYMCGVQLYEDDEITPPVLYIPFSTWPQTSTHGGSEAPRARLEKGIFRVPRGGTMK